MSPESALAEVEDQIAAWRAYVDRRREISGPDGDEIEDHLRSRILELSEAGLEPDEAFLVAVKRVGSLDAITREFAREHSDRLWKQLVLGGAQPEETNRRDLGVMLAFAVGAAVLVKLPALVGLSLDDDYDFYARNLGLLALAPLAVYLCVRRDLETRVVAVTAGLFGLGALAANAFPLSEDAPVTVLTAIHLPIALWLTVGLAYAGGEWRSGPARMDFVRFTGEWFIYYVLIALGGGVLTGLTLGTFAAIGYDVSEFVASWLLPCGAAGAVVVAAWLVESKQSVIENMAPVLTAVFTPLFVAVLVALGAGFAISGIGLGVDRDVLILFDLLLAVVLGLLLYGISARDPAHAPGWFDRWQLALVVAMLLVDALVLLPLGRRIGEFGFSANRTAALGENLILLVNLAGSAWLLLGFLRHRERFAALERWQTSYLTVYAVWAWVVVLAFPPIFGFS